ncbi:BrnA antitoxin family protein [Phenylobacterium sp.]|uniref:BrnA antitoxin family protein n=1 Tax=Phenylobacterium sp. TaxID=1871053 RepID=UPI00286EA38B|nr:BrnA antitoxin family protein [Phenylobacterium sp.]
MAPHEAGFDEDNPEWTDEVFARARPAKDVLPEKVFDALTRRRGPQKTPAKTPISLRLSPEVIEHFRAGGAGWQTRIDEALKQVIARSSAVPDS